LLITPTWGIPLALSFDSPMIKLVIVFKNGYTYKIVIDAETDLLQVIRYKIIKQLILP